MNQNKPYVVVITGGIATGKSEASKYLRELGYTLLDSDRIVHEGYKLKGDLYFSLVQCFGDVILDNDKYIDRQKLGKLVFSDNESLIKLNNIVHKYVVDKLVEGIKKCNDRLIFLDIPLLFEQKDALISMGLEYNEIWLIYVGEEIQKQRLIQRARIENKNIEETLKIIEKQMPIEEKKLLADKIIYNERTVEELRRKLLESINLIL